MKTKKYLVKGIAVACFLFAFLFVHWDRMMTYYGLFPWSVSSVKAAWSLNLIKQAPERKKFSL